MNTTQLKRFAQEARKKLITLVGGRLEAVLTQDSATLRAKADTIAQLREEIAKNGKAALIEKVAYTWFNRLVALRFMDAADFQPLGIRVLSPAEGMEGGSPQILADIHAGIFPEDLPLDRAAVNDVLNGVTAASNPDNVIFRTVLIAVCNDLHRLFPFLFERIDDYTELLLPDDLISPFSIVADVVKGIRAEDCREVEVIGWLYQFYISEKKDEVFAQKSKVKKEDIPAATQLFTPRWIVEYLVQNTVGRLWLQNFPQSGLRAQMPYYIEPVSADKDFLKIGGVEEIRLLDQACGSGHILVYGFELLAKIYEEGGYAPSEIGEKIIRHNLFGLEIDERAAQLAAFAVTMKARQYYRRAFRKLTVPNIVCYRDVTFTPEETTQIIQRYGISGKEAWEADLKMLQQATNLGSLLQPQTPPETLEVISGKLTAEGESGDLYWRPVQEKLRSALSQLLPLARKYHCVVDNPPYMGGGNMNPALSDFVKKEYPRSKADLMAAFMEAGLAALYPKGFLGMINQHSWMFLSSYEALRKHLIDAVHFDTLLHLGPRTFPEIGGEVVQNAAFTFSNGESKAKGTYLRLVDYDSSALKKEKTLEAISNPACGWRYAATQGDFEKIPGNNIGYWLSEKAIDAFRRMKNSSHYYIIKEGLKTGQNDRFIRNWNEVASNKFSVFGGNVFFPHTKGGEFRKWFGNNEDVLNYAEKGQSLKNFPGSSLTGESNYFNDYISWSRITSATPSFRYTSEGFIPNMAGLSAVVKDHESCNVNTLLCIGNSKVGKFFLDIINPTLNFPPGVIQKIPIHHKLISESNEIGNRLIDISREEWNSRETSWDFSQSELLRLKEPTLAASVEAYKSYWAQQFHTLHQNEEELNRQFIGIYGLEDELTPEVPPEDITLLKDEAKIVDGQLQFVESEIMAQLISYAVGCAFGRYSLDAPGLILANAGEGLGEYLAKIQKTEEALTFLPDEDNVLPLLEEEWFSDDLEARVRAFIRAAWGEASYAENIRTLEAGLGKDLRRYLTKDFYKDHIQRYKKRPIYWLFASPKGHFSVLIYLHRYTPDTLNFILNAYLRPFMDKLRADLQRQEDILVSGTAAEQGAARKRQTKLREMLQDCAAYEHDILFPLAGERIALDLDDGVLVNYNKFGAAIAPVAGLNDAKAKKKVREFDWIDTATIR